MDFNKKMREQEFWNRVVNNQLGRYKFECSQCQCHKMSDEEIKKYCNK